MSDALIPAAAAAQVAVIEASLTRPPTGPTARVDVAPTPDGVSWLAVWEEAVDVLHRLGRGNRYRCTGLVWSQIDLAADLEGQPWWTSPILRRATVGQIAWTTVLGRWPGSVSTADAQTRWEDRDRVPEGIHRRPAARSFMRSRLRRGHDNHPVEPRPDWQDPWWVWAATHALDAHPAAASAAVAPSGPGSGLTIAAERSGSTRSSVPGGGT